MKRAKFLVSSKKCGPSSFMVVLVFFVLVGCGPIFNKDQPRFLARVGENYLYKENVAHLLPKGISTEDSAAFVNNYINTWAAKQLLLEKAKINLPEEKLAEYDALVADYRADLYTRAYKEALVRKESDTIIAPSELEGFYGAEKENFKLKEKIVQLRFVELPQQFLNRAEVTDRLKRFGEEDKAYLDSIGVQFRKLNFNDSLWVSVSRVIEEISPLTIENESEYLKKSQFFELEHANGVYLAKIVDVKGVNQIAPLSYIEPRIKQVLLNRRKLGFLRKLETEILDEAIKKNKFEIYSEK